MGKFLAILNGAADEADAEPTAQQQAEFMAAWASWAQANERALIDPGAPLYRKRRITAHAVEDFTDAKVAYAIVEAESHEDAVRIFDDHPHLTLMHANSIEVVECLASPA